MSKNQPSNATVVEECSKRLNALKAYVTPTMQIAINGVVHKTTDVIEAPANSPTAPQSLRGVPCH